MIPDIIEQMENSAEAQYYGMIQPCGKLKCFCGNLFSEDEGEILSVNPYSMPSCPDCVKIFFNELKSKKQFKEPSHG